MMSTKIIFSLSFFLFLSGTWVSAQKTAKFEPPAGKTLLVIGQDMGAIGGFTAPNNNGYLDNLSIKPGGVTTYSSLPSLGGLSRITNYGSGDICAQCIIATPAYFR